MTQRKQCSADLARCGCAGCILFRHDNAIARLDEAVDQLRRLVGAIESDMNRIAEFCIERGRK